MDDRDLARSQDLALLLLFVSSLANTDFPPASADLLPFLVTMLGATADTPVDTRLPCLAAIRNLSANLEHVRAVAASGAVRALFALSLDEPTMSEVALCVLSDVMAASAAGRREMAEGVAAPRALVEAVARHGSARCQERTRRTWSWRSRTMAVAGGSSCCGCVGSALLEVSLLGSPLTRSRADKILEWFKDNGRDRIRAHSGPRTESSSSGPVHSTGQRGGHPAPQH